MPIDPSTDGAPVSVTPSVPSAPTTPPAATATPDLGGQQPPNLPAPTGPSVTAAPASVAAPTQGQPVAQQNPQQPQQPGQSGTVSKTPAVHPSVARAGILRNVAQALAGGPSYRTSVDPNTGQVTRTQVPLSKGDVAMALAFTALSGGLAGLGQRGPNAVGLAGAAGLAQGQQLAQQRQQSSQQQTEDAKADADSQYNALARKAQLLDINSRIATQTKSAERMDLENQQLGLQNMNAAVDTNAGLLSELQQQGGVSEDHVSQDALQAGIASAKYNATEAIALPDGIATINGKPEQTFSIIPNTALKTNLTQEQFDTYANANVPGFPKGTKLPSGGYPVSVFTLARANAQMLGVSMAKSELGQVADTLSASNDPASKELAKSIPNLDTVLSDKTNGPVLAQALGKLGKWTAYSDVHGMNLAESLHAMSQPTKADPRNPKQTVANPDQGAGTTIISALGNGDLQKGMAILQAYHDEVTPAPIKNIAEAQSIATDPTSSSREVTRAKAFLAADRAQKAGTAGAEAAARKPYERSAGTGTGTLNASALTPTEYGAIVDGIGTNTLDASQMLRYGKADQLKILADVKAKYPGFDSTQYHANLGLAKWATSGKGGDIIQSLNTLQDHAQDFAANVNALGNTDSSLLNKPVNVLRRNTGNTAIGPTLARMLAVRTEYMNTLNGNHALSVEDKSDAAKLLNEDQSPSQWLAVMQQLTHTASIRGSETNARYKATFGRDMPNYRGGSQPQPGGSANVVPPGATPGRDGNGRVIGYRTSDGKVVKF